MIYVRASYLVLLIACFWATQVAGSTQPNLLIQQAMQNMQLEKLAGWSYDRTTELNGTTYVEHFDPTGQGSKHWTLVSINGQALSSAQAAAYASGKNPVTGEALEKAADGSMLGVSGAVPDDLKDKPSLNCFSANDFKPDCRGLAAKIKQKALADQSSGGDADKAENTKKAMALILQMLAHTTGVLVVSKKEPYILSVQFISKQPFTEMHVVNIRELNSKNTFSILAEGGKAVLVTDATVMNGTAFFFKTIKQDSYVKFSNFNHVPDRADSGQ